MGLILTVFVHSLFLPSQQARESTRNEWMKWNGKKKNPNPDTHGFIYNQQESTKIFVINLLKLSRTNLSKSDDFKHATLLFLNTKHVSVEELDDSDFQEGKMPFVGRRKPPILNINLFDSCTEFTPIYHHLTSFKFFVVNAAEKGKLALTSCLHGDCWTLFFQKAHFIISWWCFKWKRNVDLAVVVKNTPTASHHPLYSPHCL